jgi:hypothetical protein
MQHRIHMHDQVNNKVNDIMKHYKKTPVEQIVSVIKHFIRQTSVA